MLSEQSGSKKPKVDVEPAMKSSESGPSVIISEALANFFGVGGREMLQSEVLRRIWEYIKLNNLEVGLVSINIYLRLSIQWTEHALENFPAIMYFVGCVMQFKP